MKMINHAVIERFHIPGTAGYSEYWRRNKSPVEAFELARLLLGIRRVASYVGLNVGTIVWSGMQAENALCLDPAMVMGSYPVPAEKTDRAIGLAIRLSYGKTEWSRRLKELAVSQMEMRPRQAAQFQFYLELCERVYLDCLSNRSPLGCYTEVQRRWAIEKNHDSASHPPTISELLHLWWGLAADRSGQRHREEYVDRSARSAFQHANLEKFYKEPMALLNSMVDELIDRCPRIPGVTERGDHRLNLYLSVWDKLFEYIQFWPIDSKDSYLLTRKIGKNLLDFDNEDQEKERGTSLVIPELMEKAAFKTIPIFTDEVKKVAQNADEIVAVEGNDIVMPAPIRIDKKMLHHLTITIRAAAERKAVVSRGQKTGKVDRRRLYRANTTGTIFKMTRTDFELRSDMTVLVDATGSMSATHKWEKVETVYQTLFAAIHAFNPKARLFAYNEIKNKCLLTEIYLKDKFYNVLPHGKTASGEAIIATILSLKASSHRKSFLLHITDGASNWGCGVKDAIVLCRREGINLLTLGIGCSEENKRSLRREYGRLVEFIERIETLPHLLHNLLRYSQWN